MKIAVHIPIFFFFLAFFETTDGQTTKDSIKDKLIKSFMPILNGTWAQASYIEDIAKTKSPFKSQHTSGVVELDIDVKGIKGDSLLVGALTVHEGTSFYVYFRKGTTATTLPTDINSDNEKETNISELGYEIDGSDTVLIVYTYNKDRKQQHKERYVKVPENSGGFQYMINRTLISGNYISTDANRNVTKVKFTNVGKVIGFTGHSTFYINTDFDAGSDDSDEICFDIQTINQQCYMYEIKDSAINLYEENENPHDDKPRLGQLKFRLVKQSKM